MSWSSKGLTTSVWRGRSRTPSAADLIAGHQQMIERAHVRGLKIIGATLTPFEGAAYYTPEGEAKRQAVNAWIRTSKAYDGVIDFDAVIRDPAQQTKFLPCVRLGRQPASERCRLQGDGEAMESRALQIEARG